MTLDDYAFYPGSSVYYFQNPNYLGEYFYFYRFTWDLPSNPDWINFNRERARPRPADHAPLTSATTRRQHRASSVSGSHFSYNILQADGLQELEAGDNLGDPNDPFPGGTDKRVWERRI